MLTKAQHRAALVALTCLIIFINDLDLVNCPEASLSKCADDTTMQVVVNKADNDCASDVISQYLSWSSTNCMPCNLSKCKELVLKKKGQVNPSPIGNMVQAESLVLLGVTFQGNGRFTQHIKRKLLEANKCLYVLRSLRKEGYNQVEIDHLFQSLVLPKILSVYTASTPELNTVQQFLRRCHKRSFISYAIDIDIYDLLEKKQTGQSPRRLVACLLIPCIICCPELKNLQNV